MFSSHLQPSTYTLGYYFFFISADAFWLTDNEASHMLLSLAEMSSPSADSSKANILAKAISENINILGIEFEYYEH